ncbi:MAG: hypothetical protein J0I26_09200 [Alphaproteobacteria bacterium]|jgi:hypothetical protein|nr:hypothetical protein [Alphaproteobacteria bacterium]MBN9557686.1 hypothetical protein [Alphaproteobacteria bacterium]MBN9567165.1 hypothetical protein [Alphaproteobacteria bacterium]MBN9593015.1 hypothetical protein [Alphaproteobacteria bacterium]
MGWGLRVLLAIIVLAIIGGFGLLFYASTLSPPQTAFEQTLSNDRFPG